MAEAKRPLKVFLCHARTDRDRVRALYTRLINDGVDVWLDKEKLLPGQDWELEIRKAVREADVVVVCLSKQFNQAGFRQKEVRLALDTAMEKPEGEIFIIPARLEECDTLESLRKWHWVDLFEDDGYERLMRALRTRADKIGATLQIKKGWLPKITSPRPNVEKPVEKRESNKSKAKSDEESVEQKAQNESAEKAAQEKMRRKLEREVKKVVASSRRNYRWGKLKIEIRYRLQLLWAYRAPILILLVTFAIIVPLLIRLSNLIPQITSTFDNTTPTATINLPLAPQQNLTSTETFIPTEIFTPSSTPTEIITSTATPLPTEITDTKGVSMMLVPAGNFMMGEDVYWRNLAGPAHQVYLDAYYMDKYEVTNAHYKACVDTGTCEPPVAIRSETRLNYYGNPEFDDYPVIYVDWNQAKTYCEWRGGSLPTEAQWEKAASGTDGRAFPWGTYSWGEENICDFANIQTGLNYCVGDTIAVGRYESGKSPYGIFDLFGNVYEWVADWYSDTYYQNSPSSNPTGPDSGDYRVMRGGSWHYWDGIVSRATNLPYNTSNSIGFRCVRNTNP